jgi:hypothetical protein
MTLPGRRLRTVAARLLSPTTMERVIDPVIADMQSEYAEAASVERSWKRRSAQWKGYLAFWATLVAYACEHTAAGSRDWVSADQWTVGRMLSSIAIITTGAVC